MKVNTLKILPSKLYFSSNKPKLVLFANKDPVVSILQKLLNSKKNLSSFIEDAFYELYELKSLLPSNQKFKINSLINQLESLVKNKEVKTVDDYKKVIREVAHTLSPADFEKTSTPKVESKPVSAEVKSSNKTQKKADNRLSKNIDLALQSIMTGDFEKAGIFLNNIVLGFNEKDVELAKVKIATELLKYPDDIKQMLLGAVSDSIAELKSKSISEQDDRVKNTPSTLIEFIVRPIEQSLKIKPELDSKTSTTVNKSGNSNKNDNSSRIIDSLRKFNEEFGELELSSTITNNQLDKVLKRLSDITSQNHLGITTIDDLLANTDPDDPVVKTFVENYSYILEPSGRKNRVIENLGLIPEVNESGKIVAYKVNTQETDKNNVDDTPLEKQIPKVEIQTDDGKIIEVKGEESPKVEIKKDNEKIIKTKSEESPKVEIKTDDEKTIEVKGEESPKVEVKTDSENNSEQSKKIIIETKEKEDSVENKTKPKKTVIIKSNSEPLLLPNMTTTDDEYYKNYIKNLYKKVRSSLLPVYNAFRISSSDDSLSPIINPYLSSTEFEKLKTKLEELEPLDAENLLEKIIRRKSSLETAFTPVVYDDNLEPYDYTKKSSPTILEALDIDLSTPSNTTRSIPPREIIQQERDMPPSRNIEKRLLSRRNSSKRARKEIDTINKILQSIRSRATNVDDLLMTVPSHIQELFNSASMERALSQDSFPSIKVPYDYARDLVESYAKQSGYSNPSQIISRTGGTNNLLKVIDELDDQLNEDKRIYKLSLQSSFSKLLNLIKFMKAKKVKVKFSKKYDRL